MRVYGVGGKGKSGGGVREGDGRDWEVLGLGVRMGVYGGGARQNRVGWGG